MLFLETLRNKPLFKKNGEQIKDLTAKSVDFRGDMFIIDTVVVSSDFIMRSDLIAKVEFRNANKMDYLLKFNGISNPFSIDEGDILLVPDMSEMRSAIQPLKSTVDSEGKSAVVKKFFDPNRLNKKDIKRIDYLKQKSSELANGSANNLPPNFAEPGAKELKVVDGKVIFGGDVVKNAENCIDPLSKARAKSKIIQNKIFRNTN